MNEAMKVYCPSGSRTRKIVADQNQLPVGFILSVWHLVMEPTRKRYVAHADGVHIEGIDRAPCNRTRQVMSKLEALHFSH